MSVHVRCRCGYHMELPDEWSGKQGRCPQCHSVLNIPDHNVGGAAAELETSAGTGAAHSVEPGPQAALESPLALILKHPMWLTAGCVGLSLLLAGLILVLGEARGPQPASGTQGLDPGSTAVPAPAEPSTVFRPVLPSGEATGAATAAAEHAATESAVPPSADASQPAVAGPAMRGTGSGAAIDQCRLGDFGVLVPPGVASIEVDGVRLPVRDLAGLVQSKAMPLVLPYGKHVVRFHSSEPPRVVEPKRWFLDAYREAAAQVQEDGRWSFDRLLEQSRRALDRFTEPLVPHFWGNYYWQEGEHDAAARHYTWALEIAPTFAPAYLNLAQLAHERGDDDAARRYLRLADLWNVQNAFGLSLAANTLRGAIDSEALAIVEDDADWLMADSADLSDRDRDMVAVLSSAAEFAPQGSDRAKILNNLGAYFEYTGKPHRALESYRSAAGVLTAATLQPEERRVIGGILQNLARVCRQANMPEYRRYERLQALVER